MCTKRLIKIISIALIICLTGLLTSCYNIKRMTMTDLASEGKFDEDKGMVLIKDKNKWILEDVSIKGDFLIAGNCIKSDNPRQYFNQIVYLTLHEDAPAPGDGPVKIHYSSIEKIELHDLDRGKTVFMIGGGYCITLGAILLCFLFTKQSCPFVYAYSGDSFDFIGEIYSGAVFPEEERDDYLVLSNIAPKDFIYLIKIVNVIKNETQHTNLAELYVFDHPPQSGLLIDKYGNHYTIRNPQSPLKAEVREKDITELIREKDLADISIKNMNNMFYEGGIFDDDCLMDEIILTFKRPENVKKGKLIIRARNTMWLDYVYREFCYQFGNLYDKWKEKSKDQKNLHKWKLDQGIPLSVYLDAAGKWQFIDYFNIAGPIEFRDDILSIDLSKVNSENIRIKLKAGIKFWQLDYAAMDFSLEVPVSKQIVYIAAAADQNDNDVSGLLSRNDNQYYIQENYGDEVLIEYFSPPLLDHLERTVVLHSKGYYDVHIFPLPAGKPNLKRLNRFKREKEFIRFSKHLYLKIYGEDAG